MSREYPPALKAALERAKLCWDDLRAGDIVHTTVGDKIKCLYLVVENSRKGHYIRLVSLEDGDLTELPKDEFAHRTLRESRARLYTGTVRVFA